MQQAAQIIKDNHQKIITLWKKEVQHKILASQYSNEIALLDHLPNVLNALSDLMLRYDNLEKAYEDEKYKLFIENSADHGRHRAASPKYTVDRIIHEYIIFHRIVTNQLIAHSVYEQRVADLLKYVVETAMLQSSGAFAVSIREMQEKLVGTLAHDIRNPLTTSLMALQLMTEENDPESLAQLRSMALRGIQRSLKLTEGLLDTITVESGEGMMLDFIEDDIVHHVKWVVKEATEIYTQNINLVCSKDVIKGVFDGVAVRRVLENLITNAIKYGTPEGPVTIKVDDYKEIVKLTVHNFGNPIPENRQKSIFRFLNRNDEGNPAKIQSWGIGLTMVKMVVEAHGGDIELQSSSEQGTSFITTFPKHSNQPGKVRTKLNYKPREDQ